MAIHIWLNLILGAMIVSAIVGIPLWMTFKRPERSPDHTSARAYLRARSVLMAPATAGPSTARRHASADRVTVTGRRHAAVVAAQHTQRAEDKAGVAV